MIDIRCCRAEETPAPFLDLAWQVFFADRGRGVSLDTHFPWLRGGGRDDISWLLNVGGQPAAMLCIRRGTVAGVGFHAIGLVCTAPAFQRHGFATRLLCAALASIGDDAPVLLWTSQHAFYERLGFELLDPSVIATCVFSAPISFGAWQRADWSEEARESPLFDGRRGLPSFVTSAERWCLRGPSAVSLVVADGAMPIVLESCEGITPALLASTGVSRLVLNLPRRIPLLEDLRSAGNMIDVREAAIAMWRPGHVGRDTIMSWDLSLLDRF